MDTYALIVDEKLDIFVLRGVGAWGTAIFAFYVNVMGDFMN